MNFRTVLLCTAINLDVAGFEPTVRSYGRAIIMQIDDGTAARLFRLIRARERGASNKPVENTGLIIYFVSRGTERERER